MRNPVREEIYFRKIYRDLIGQTKITTVFRPGNRLHGHPKGFREGEIVNLRIIVNVGAEWAKIHAELDPAFIVRAQITSLEAKTLGDLRKADFKGSSPDVQDVEQLRYHLGVIYNLNPSQLRSTTVVTRTAFKYL